MVALAIALVVTTTAGPEDVADRFHVGAIFETALVVNDYRESGGNEMSVGDTTVGLVASWRLADTDDILAELIADWRPEAAVLDFAARENYHQGDRGLLRADGFENRPAELVEFALRWRSVEARVGSFRAYGLEALAPPTRHHLATPLPLAAAIHYDKGIQIGVEEDGTGASFSVVDGDWTPGEPSVFRRFGSEANSSPSLALRATTNRGGFRLGAEGFRGTTGSARGEKRLRDGATAWLASTVGRVEMRGWGLYLARTAAGEGDGRSSPRVETVAAGLDAALRSGRWTATGSGWWAERYHGPPDGEVWFDEADESAWGASLGLRIDRLMGIQGAFVGAHVGTIVFGGSADLVAVVGLGVDA